MKNYRAEIQSIESVLETQEAVLRGLNPEVEANQFVLEATMDSIESLRAKLAELEAAEAAELEADRIKSEAELQEAEDARIKLEAESAELEAQAVQKAEALKKAKEEEAAKRQAISSAKAEEVKPIEEKIEGEREVSKRKKLTAIVVVAGVTISCGLGIGIALGGNSEKEEVASLPTKSPVAIEAPAAEEPIEPAELAVPVAEEPAAPTEEEQEAPAEEPAEPEEAFDRFDSASDSDVAGSSTTQTPISTEKIMVEKDVESIISENFSLELELVEYEDFTFNYVESGNFIVKLGSEATGEKTPVGGMLEFSFNLQEGETFYLSSGVSTVITPDGEIHNRTLGEEIVANDYYQLPGEYKVQVLVVTTEASGTFVAAGCKIFDGLPPWHTESVGSFQRPFDGHWEDDRQASDDGMNKKLVVSRIVSVSGEVYNLTATPGKNQAVLSLDEAS